MLLPDSTQHITRLEADPNSLLTELSVKTLFLETSLHSLAPAFKHTQTHRFTV